MSLATQILDVAPFDCLTIFTWLDGDYVFSRFGRREMAKVSAQLVLVVSVDDGSLGEDAVWDQDTMWLLPWKQDGYWNEQVWDLTCKLVIEVDATRGPLHNRFHEIGG